MNRQKKLVRESTHKKGHRAREECKGDKINEFMFMSLQFVAVVVVGRGGSMNTREKDGNREKKKKEKKYV